MKRALLMFDAHFPFVDRKAWELALMMGEDVGVDEVHIGGDFFDFYDINGHGKSRDILWQLEDEIESGNGGLAQVRKTFPTAKRYFIEGNHEYRLRRYINKNAPELAGIVSFSNTVKMEENGFEYVPYGPYQKQSVLGLSDLFSRHEPLVNGMHIAQNTALKAGTSIICGHAHRSQTASAVLMNGQLVQGFCVGTLANIKHPVMSYVKNFHQWQNGIAFATEVDGEWFVDNLVFKNYKCVYNGYLYKN